MFTKHRFTPPVEPVLTGNYAKDVRTLIEDRRRTMLALSEWFERLEEKDAIQIDEASITAANGIIFPSGTISDYVPPTAWTPSLAGSTTPGTQTYAVAVGTATKIGSAVIANWSIGLSAKDGTTAGNLRITGLPYTSGATYSWPAALGYVRNFDLDAAGGFTNVQAIVGPGVTYLDLYESGDNVVPAPLTAADFGATSYIYGTVIYNT